MQNKRGLSSVITTILLILLILAAIGAIWLVITSFLNEGAQNIGFGGLTLDLVITNVSINYTSGIATVQVRRNEGSLGEEITAIKFIVEDKRNAEVIEKEAKNFVQLSKRTFELNLTENNILILSEIYKISIAPVYLSGLGTSDEIAKTGEISDEVTGLDSNQTVTPILPDIVSCTIDSDCGTDFWVSDTKTCNSDNTGVEQYKTIFQCTSGFCQSSSSSVLKEACSSGYTCYVDSCILETRSCTTASDCGTNAFTGFPVCSTTSASIVQNYNTYLCVNQTCQSSSTLELIEECLEGEVCSSAECFVPLECTQDSDCDFGEICEEGSCVPETVVLEGSVLTAWPFGMGEYFDSLDLPKTATRDYGGYFIFFPSSAETRCLKVLNFVDSPIEGANSYIRLNESETNITAEDQFQIWKTEYGCTLI